MKHRQFKQLIARHKKLLIGIGAGLLGLILVVQVIYPSDRLLPFVSIEGVNLGGWSKRDAAERLDGLSSALKIDVKVAGSSEAHRSVKPGDFGLTIKNQARVEAMQYPWFLRLVPTSLFWVGLTISYGTPTYERSEEQLKTYVTKTYGEGCIVQPTNATVIPKGDQLVVTPAKDGGRCEMREIIGDFMTSLPTIEGGHTITVEVEPISADISTKTAMEFRDTLVSRIKDGVKVNTLGEEIVIPFSEMTKWIRVVPLDKQLTVDIDSVQSNIYFDGTIAKKVVITPGTTYVTTRDFAEISRKNGATGRALDRDVTRESILKVLKGEEPIAAAAMMPVAPNVQYTYTYTKSKEGISALMKNYDTEHAGEFAAFLIELDGSGVAQYNADKIWVTASTYKLFVAYGVIRKVDAGQWSWNDSNISGGQNLEQCFEVMIVRSDNTCAEAMLKKLGFSWLTNELNAIGLTKSTFMHEDIETSVADLALFLTKLQRGDLSISSAGRSRLLSAMSRQIYRQGIPAGASGSVSDKVGFMNGLLHDAAIVYSPKGTYVLVIMSNGSSWANIAELTRKIDELR